MTLRALRFALPLFVLLAALPAFANTELTLKTKIERNPHDFAEHKAVKPEVSVAHTFDNGLIWGGATEANYPSGGGKLAYKAETTLGYKLPLDDTFSLKGSIGIGERFYSGDAFGFYVLRAGIDAKLDDTWSWSIFNYRYRESFDTDNDYTTPEASTQVSYRLDDKNALYAGYFYGWKEGNSDVQGLELGYKYKF